jgi:hypothetical protein
VARVELDPTGDVDRTQVPVHQPGAVLHGSLTGSARHSFARSGGGAGSTASGRHRVFQPKLRHEISRPRRYRRPRSQFRSCRWATHSSSVQHLSRLAVGRNISPDSWSASRGRLKSDTRQTDDTSLERASVTRCGRACQARHLGSGQCNLRASNSRGSVDEYYGQRITALDERTVGLGPTKRQGTVANCLRRACSQLRLEGGSWRRETATALHITDLALPESAPLAQVLAPTADARP